MFTCLYSRAVHVEPLPYLDTPTFQNSLRRFIAVRGPCTLIRSDQGTNFIGTIADVDFLKVSNFLKSENSEWKLNPPHSSNFGGVWERKIGQLRRAMDAALLKTSNRTLSRDELYTFLQEAASIVNSTPLWAISEDPNDPSPISPSMLLTYRKSPIGSNDNFSEEDILSYGKKRWRRVQFVADVFWKHWRSNYLEGLRTRQKWLSKKPSLSKGDIVLIRDKNLKRNSWPFGIIEETYPSRDQLVRSAKIKVITDGKNKSFAFYDRPICDLVLLMKTES